MDLGNLNNELNQMRAETLGDAGKKLEIITEILEKETERLKRLTNIKSRLENYLKTGEQSRKKKIFRRLLERLTGKIDRLNSSVNKMTKTKAQLMSSYILQREALGLIDHTWVDEFYSKKGKNEDIDNK